MFHLEAVELQVDGSVDFMYPLCLVDKTVKNDTFHYHQAMQPDDRDEFIKAMQKDLHDYIKKKFLVMVLRNTIVYTKTVKAI